MNLLSFLKPVARPIVDGLIASAEAQKPAILAALAADNQKAADAVETAIVTSLLKQPKLAPLVGLVDIKGIVAQSMPQLVAVLGSEEDVLFEATIAHLRAIEAQAFGA